MPAFVQQAVDWWSSAFASHIAVSALVIFAHVAGVVVAGGTALWTDRAILGAATPADRERVLAELPGVHRVVLRALALVIAAGVLLALADLESLLPAPAYRVKLTAVALLLANGWQLQRAERKAASGAPRDWTRLRTSARLSRVLWFATILAGVVVAER